jgi:lysozyme
VKGAYTNPALITLALVVLTGGGYIGLSESDEDAVTNGLIAADLKQTEEAVSNYKELLQRIHVLETQVEVLKTEMNFNRVKAALKRDEGKSNTVYLDSVGVQTIGFGHNLENPLSDRALECILEDDVRLSLDELNRAFPHWTNHDEHRQDVLAQMMYNLGANRLASFRKFWAALENKDYNLAASEMLDSKWADQVGERAERLAEEMMDL